MVATDGTSLSKKSVKTAIELASLLGAELIALKVTKRYPQSYFEGSIQTTVDEMKKIEKKWSESAQKIVDAVVKVAKQKGVNARALVVKSDIVSDAIISSSKKNKVDLIVMASHGRRGIKRLLLGSETNQVLTHAGLHVLVVR
jgi:nucleotide-binding universal stress UspA family protein